MDRGKGRGSLPQLHVALATVRAIAVGGDELGRCRGAQMTDTAVFSILESVRNVGGREGLARGRYVVLAQGDARRGPEDISGSLLDMALPAALVCRMGCDGSPPAIARGKLSLPNTYPEK